MNDKPMTVGELIEKLKTYDEKLPVHIFTPEVLLMSGSFKVGQDQINWFGQYVYLLGDNWFRKPPHI